jgi:hypothetical protein
MGAMKKIVVEQFPVDRLPAELREGLEAGRTVKITVEGDAAAESLPPLASYIGAAQGVYSDPGDAAARIGALRDEWE